LDKHQGLFFYVLGRVETSSKYQQTPYKHIISQICEQFYTFEERQMKKGEKSHEKLAEKI